MNSVNSPTGPLGRFQFVLTRAALLALMAIQLAASSAAPFVQWAKVYGTPGYDGANDMALAPNGQVYLAGVSAADVLLRFDQDGTLLGSQSYRGAFIRGVATDPAGNYYLTGLIRDSEQLGVGLNNHFYLAKYSSGGSLIWERTGGGPGDPDIGYPWGLGGSKIALDAAGNIYVTGSSTGPAAFNGITLPDSPGGPLLCKYAPDGNLLWVKRVEGVGGAGGIALAPDGSIVLTGYLNNGTADFGGIVATVAGRFDGDFFLAKFSSSGDAQWARIGYGGTGVATDSRGNIYFNGMAEGNTKLQCGKFDPAGSLLWEHRIPNAAGGAVALDAREEPVFQADIWAAAQLGDLRVPYNGLGTLVEAPIAVVCKADSAGNFKWAVADTGRSWTWGGPIQSDRKGHVYVAGRIKCAVDLNGQFVCGTSRFGSFSLRMLYPNADNNADIFLLRLFDADAVVPELKITRTPSGLALAWPVAATNYVLEATTSLPAVSWTTVTNTPTVTTNERSVQLPLTGPAQFFRLRQP